MGKEKITTAELETLIIKELRKHPECDHVISVGFTRPIQTNWAPAFSCNGPNIAPAIAFEIAQRFQRQYDLV